RPFVKSATTYFVMVLVTGRVLPFVLTVVLIRSVTLFTSIPFTHHCLRPHVHRGDHQRGNFISLRFAWPWNRNLCDSRAVIGRAKPRSAPPCYGNWQVEEKLGGTDRYTEYRARHTLLGARRGGTARLRIYQVDAYLPEEERQRQASPGSIGMGAPCRGC